MYNALFRWSCDRFAECHDRCVMANAISGLVPNCHDHDRTYPYLPYPDLSTPIPSHLNHSRAPNTKPEPSDPLASQQCTPEHSDSLASSQHIPDPMLLQPFLSLASSRFPTPTLIPDPTHPRPLLFLTSSRFPTFTPIPDPTPFDLLSSCVSPIPNVLSVSQLRSGEAQSHTSLARCVLVCLFSLSIYLYVPLCLITCYPLFVSSVSSSVPCLCPPSFHLSLFLPPSTLL